ncbi:LuxR C-terminal-related transcriptional regulator [Clostridium sp. OS1-26]|uniref:LuxR C-terminal-related transcriptional regulator n=1 Tax=Clostridium sp. OS1-26 TaxID=3070681 RepID=UPI0027E0C704|nr:LuxR C-terminal-related transcriptional regulator [Clostridium sp. OS1-26]WML36694.1 LuxR C-terminal-related transcriptional regulator [Clostridium sp. OS1-26]
MRLNYKHIKAKFMIPKKKCKVIYRDELLNKLDKALNTKLTIISAPAGSGKTTSVISWISLRNLSDNTIWISLDERDDNPEVFWSCFVAVIEELRNNGFKCDAINFYDQDVSIESIIEALLNSISSINKDLVFVMDDFHCIKNKDILLGIKNFIDSIPDNIHLIITSRTKPNINISKLRLDGEVTEIDRNELSFSLDETSEFLSNMGVQIPEEGVKILNERTEGWIAGLQIAVLSMQEKKDIMELVEGFCGSNKYVQDYFDEEVFCNQSEETIEFLLNTCILDELTADLCNAVNCQKNSQQILEKIYEENLFIEKLDCDGKSFRYYRLFKEFLINKVSGLNKDKIYEASSKAAEWYEGNGLINNAINQYVRVENFHQVEKLLEEECIKKILSNDYFYVMYWLENMPQDIIIKNPRLCITYMYIHIYDDSNYNKYLELTEKIIESYGDEEYRNECLGTLSIVKGDKGLIRSEYKKSIKYYEDALGYLKNDVFWSAIINLKLGIAYFYSKDFVSERKSFDQAALLSQSYQDNSLSLVINRAMIFTKFLRGQLIECENICNECLSNNVSDELKKPSLMAIFYIILALVYYEKNEISKAEEYVLKGIKFAEKQGDFYTHYYTLCLGYYVYQGILMEKGSKGEIDKINEKIEELSQKYGDNKLLDRYHFHKLKDYFEIFKMERFMEYDKINLVEKRVTIMDFRLTEEIVVFAKMLIFKGKFDDALMLLNKVLNFDKEQDNKYLSIRAHIYRTEIFCQKDQYENATKDLREALNIGYENGFVRVFLFKHLKMSKILLKTIKAMKFNKDYHKMGEYLNRILALYSTKENNELISKREKEVLMLIENGAKNSEIAQKLFISESTAKSHILNIFSKLGVRNRIQAVAKAKEIGII